ncbi:MAG: integrase family protein [Candidatus Nitrohelix vancouverensis]|uniref:Integrase family protein n=1 Tax=Candidatus Nitrohelix vancouverensis TaxID=2705534 RepID=A0A7T0G4X0_9BACT|nr:MAG: integrase family protein [Candidatus Nitrohelix vancouverensis]
MDRVAIPREGQAFLRDSLLQGFGVRITSSGTKSFIVEKRIGSKIRRMTLGHFGELTAEQARRQAQKLLGEIAQGIDPVAEKKKQKQVAITLVEAYQEFINAKKNLKRHTLYDYERMFNVAFSDWHKKPITGITKPMIIKRHRELGEKRGHAYANGAMRFLRSFLGYVKVTQHDDSGRSILYENPVLILTDTRSWYRQHRRQTVIKAHELPAWFDAVLSLKMPENPDSTHVIADYLLFLLFSGLRRQEAAQLLWENVDLKDETLLIPDPKNHEPLNLPLSSFLVKILNERKKLAVNEYVFPGKDGRGYLIEPKRSIKKVIEQSKVHFIIHDLRRTFITIAESLEISPYAIKRLVNHKMNNDVTAGYIISDIDRLRKPMQKIADKLLDASNSNGQKKMIFLEERVPVAASFLKSAEIV